MMKKIALRVVMLLFLTYSIFAQTIYMPLNIATFSNVAPMFYYQSNRISLNTMAPTWNLQSLPVGYPISTVSDYSLSFFIYGDPSRQIMFTILPQSSNWLGLTTMNVKLVHVLNSSQTTVINQTITLNGSSSTGSIQNNGCTNTADLNLRTPYTDNYYNFTLSLEGNTPSSDGILNATSVVTVVYQ